MVRVSQPCRRTVSKAAVRYVRDIRIGAQIEADWSQRLKFTRARSWHYSTSNLRSLCQLAHVAEVGLDLWSYTAPSGASLMRALEYLIPTTLAGLEAWPHREIDPVFDRSLAHPLLHVVAEAGARRAGGRVADPQGRHEVE